MKASLKVGDSVELEGVLYKVKYSWLEHQRHDVAKRCIRMESADGAIWAGYQRHLNELLGGLRPSETLNET